MITAKPFSKFSPAPGNTVVQQQGLRGMGADSSVTVNYSGSTCQTFDANGLCVANVWIPDASNPLPSDPGVGDAVAQWAANQQQQISSRGLLTADEIQAYQQATGVCSALGIPCPTNIPAPFKIPSGLAWLLVIGVTAVVIAGVKK